MLRLCIVFFVTTLIATAAVEVSKSASILSKQIDRVLKNANSSQYFNADALMSVPTLIKKYGYPVEKHKVATEDGYILELHRIPGSRETGSEVNKSYATRQAVLLLHGLLGSSADFIVSGPNGALGYLLADAGYDVWLGNARGNFYSRAHKTRNPDDRFGYFWNFGWEEIGKYDLSAMTDYVLKMTGLERIHYIGHSQGTTAFFVLASLRPDYNRKFATAHLLAPVAFMDNFPTKWVADIAIYTNLVYDMGSVLGISELLPRGSLMTYEGPLSQCDANSMLMSFCQHLVPAYTKIKNRVILGHFPSGSSLRQLAHYGQLIEAKRFQRWDYGGLKNVLHYGRVNPTAYNLSKITVDVALIYADGDALVAGQDVANIASKLPKAVLKKVDSPAFNHFDFCWSDNARDLVYDFIVGFIRNKTVR